MAKLLLGLFACAGIAFAGAANAAPISKDVYNAENKRIEDQYKADRDACKSLNGNQKDICAETAKGKEKVAKADNDAAYKDTEKAHYDARVARAEADYAVAKEKCDDRSGNDKDVCVKEAKAAETKAKANAKSTHVAADSRKDAADDKRTAEYKVAVEKCDSLTGDAKSQCVRDAKARYGKT
jgi:membrane protein involved in colicin uptake